MIKIMLDDGAKMPTRAHTSDAGLDLYCIQGVIVEPNSSAAIDTGVHIALEEGTFGQLVSKSGLNVKHGIVCCGGTIDAGYTGSIVVKVYNHSNEWYTFDPGDKVAQMIIMKHETPDMVQVNSLDETERGDNGFGSSGR